MTMSRLNTYARKSRDQTHRPLKFVGALEGALDIYLPETRGGAPKLPVKSHLWRTVRLRPEVMAGLEALRTRYAANNPAKPDITVSEVMAASLAMALQKLVAGEFRR
jgi:hypothetical protein